MHLRSDRSERTHLSSRQDELTQMNYVNIISQQPLLLLTHIINKHVLTNKNKRTLLASIVHLLMLIAH